MNKLLKTIMQAGLKVAEGTIPGIHVIEDAVVVLKGDASGQDKLAALEKAVLDGGLPAAEFGADRDLLDDAKVRSAWRGFASAYVTFLNALRDAKAAKVAHPTAPAS